MFKKIFIIIFFLILFSACSKNQEEIIYQPLEKTNPYELYKEGLTAFERNDFFFAENADLFFLAGQHLFLLLCSDLQQQPPTKPCGLSPRKSKAIYELSKILVEEHGGEVPENIESPIIIVIPVIAKRIEINPINETVSLR